MASSLRVYGSPGTLYSKCGGIFGIAAFADRCMDKWMADPTLNANQAVATWHEKAQRCGFKFLVVQIVCNLTGGPQQYTGLPMDTAHKHLNIRDEEWEKFMELFNEVCQEFGLPGDVTDDLNALMISMEFDCVVQPGERVPPPPPPQSRRIGGSSLYARCGGVYPIALFADRMVDALLQDERVRMPHDGQKRTEAALKYLFTELLCNITGGPEVVTCKEADETKLLVPKAAWQVFVATAQQACDHLPVASRSALVQQLQRSKYLIVDPTSSDSDDELLGAAQVKTIQEAAAGKMLSKEAIAARHAAPGAHVAARKRVLGDPRTLYGRAGGVFNLAKVADRLMEAWMANRFLNANEKVARWHESSQKFGFKFLVTQIMGYLTGGPQRYTGRPMDVAHKHLNISEEEWEHFMGAAKQTFDEMQLGDAMKQDLLKILMSFKADCTVTPPEVPAPEPGPSKPDPATAGTLYHNLGGVYPIAQFVDRLVEKVFAAGSGVRIELGTEEPKLERHAPGLKYMLTELVCSGTGGPEVVTSKGFDDAKLGVQPQEWPVFVTLATQAAEVWPSPILRNAVIATLGEVKSEICVGVFGNDTTTPSAAVSAVQRVQSAGFSIFDASAALEHCGGDAEKALDLLVSGWTPAADGMAQIPGTSSSLGVPGTSSSLGDDIPRCPFSGSSSSAGRCPFSGQAAAAPPAPPAATAPAAAAAPVDERLKNAALSMAQSGMPIPQIAQLLSLDEASVQAALQQPAADGEAPGRVLGSVLQAELDKLLVEDPELCCPITLTLFTDPVIASDGFMYEKSSLVQLLRNPTRHGVVSPMTREQLTKDYLPARQRKSDALEFRQKRGQELLNFAAKALSETETPRLASEAIERVEEYVAALGEGGAGLKQRVEELKEKLRSPRGDGLLTRFTQEAAAWLARPVAL